MLFNSGETSIVAWNVASLRTSYESVPDADIIFLQEIKTKTIEPYDSYFKGRGYMSYYNLGCFGTCVYYRRRPIGLKSLDWFGEGRVIVMVYPDITLICTYAVNAGVGLKNMKKKMAWFDHMDELLATPGPVLWMGDMNVVHKLEDIWIDKRRIRSYERQPGFSPPERSRFDELLTSHNLIDLFRYKNRDRSYTYWSYRSGARKNYIAGKSNLGWRLDYFLSRGLDPQYTTVSHMDIVSSDHIPIKLTYKHIFPFIQELVDVKVKNGVYYKTTKSEEKALHKMYEYADYHGHTLYIAYQPAPNNYKFMSFDSVDSFDEYYQTSKRQHYEIIRDGCTARLFLDIDNPDPINFLKIAKRFGESKYLRSKKGYHIIVDKSCDIPTMKAYVQSLNIDVDTKIYTKNRLFRLPYSSKAGTDDPFIPINLQGHEISIQLKDYLVTQYH